VDFLKRAVPLLAYGALWAAPCAAQSPLLCTVVHNKADPTQDYCQNPNFPTYGSGTTNGVITTPLPANAAAELGDGLALQHGATNAFSLVMGKNVPGANMTTSESIRDMFYFNYITGNLYTTVGCPIDTGQSCGASPFNAVARHYKPGDPNDLHVMANEGMQLRATCTGAGKTNCTQGNVYAGMVRVPFEIRPGMTVKVRYRSPKGSYSWSPIWMFSGSEVSPGPETVANPYVYPYNYPIQYPTSNATYEVDLNDNYARWYNSPSVATGFQLDYGTPNIYGIPWITPPYMVYMANTGGFSSYPNAAPPFVSTPDAWSKGFHDLVMSWNATSNMIYVYADGHLAFQSYLDYSFAPWYTDPADGVYKQQAMHLIIGNQAIPVFDPNANSATNNDGMINGWTITVQEISAWYGVATGAN
jgi:hypothetical protein